MVMTTSIPDERSVGGLLRTWRQRRRLSQLSLAADAEISQRHLSFVESGRSVPSREMLLHLADQLSIPLRERNTMLVAAGYAPIFPEKHLDDPDFEAAKRAVELILKGHEPHPALALDRHWYLVAANRAVAPLLAGVDQRLLEPPLNVLRLSLHPEGLAPKIVNIREWRAHIVERLDRQIDQSADATLAALRKELVAYPIPADAIPYVKNGAKPLAGLAVELRLDTPDGRLSFISTTTIFGTAFDVSLSELVIESFFPADSQTADTMNGLAAASENKPSR